MTLRNLPRSSLLAVASLLLAPVALAQAGASAAAETLFRDGKKAFEEKRYSEACPKLQESYRLDPGTGTLLALAACHEGEGRTASAWTEFTDAATRAKQEGRADRAQAAQARAAALEAKLAKLTIRVARGADTGAGFEVKLDGVMIGAPSWGTALPVDRGRHALTASAPGKKPWSGAVTVVADSTAQTIEVPKLEDVAATVAAVVPPPQPVKADAKPAAPVATSSSHALEWTLIGGGAAVGLAGC